MKRFRFSLERVMHFREAQVASEKQKLLQLTQQLLRATEAVNQLRASRDAAEGSVRQQATISGSDLNALAGHRIGLHRKERSLLQSRAELEVQIVDQRRQLIKVMRQHKLLEKLRGRRMEVWTYESNREAEQLAAESFLSRWNRKQLGHTRISGEVSDI